MDVDDGDVGIELGTRCALRNAGDGERLARMVYG